MLIVGLDYLAKLDCSPELSAKGPARDVPVRQIHSKCRQTAALCMQREPKRANL